MSSAGVSVALQHGEWKSRKMEDRPFSVPSGIKWKSGPLARRPGMCGRAAFTAAARPRVDDRPFSVPSGMKWKSGPLGPRVGR